ncbi:hypothetical protein F2Q70_00012212 [Brassica cretica]|uniref:Uncharacterized protein n=1 Tax=Brassica cretica TaxID=69181 RepID=A0A8S9M8S5_BRACR|nr:hypothetical protein F2Q70_00012212 [Brassica cretica]
MNRYTRGKVRRMKLCRLGLVLLCSVTDSPSTSLRLLCFQSTEMDSETQRTIALLEARSEYREVNDEDAEFDIDEELSETEAEVQTEAEIYKRTSEAYEALSTRLGEQKFLFEDRSCTLVFCHRLTINKSQVALFSVYRKDDSEMDSETQRTIALLEARSEYREVNDEDAEFDIDEELSESEAEVQREA